MDCISYAWRCSFTRVDRFVSKSSCAFACGWSSATESLKRFKVDCVWGEIETWQFCSFGIDDSIYNFLLCLWTGRARDVLWTSLISWPFIPVFLVWPMGDRCVHCTKLLPTDVTCTDIFLYICRQLPLINASYLTDILNFFLFFSFPYVINIVICTKSVQIFFFELYFATELYIFNFKLFCSLNLLFNYNRFKVVVQLFSILQFQWDYHLFCLRIQ